MTNFTVPLHQNPKRIRVINIKKKENENDRLYFVESDYFLNSFSKDRKGH